MADHIHRLPSTQCRGTGRRGGPNYSLRMTARRLRLKEGNDPDVTVQRLAEAVTDARNISARTMGFGPEAMRDAYLRWTEATEDLLRGSTLDAEVPASLFTRRYELIRGMGAATPRPWPLVNGEIEHQTRQLQHYADDLHDRIRNARSGRHTVVLDTSALLEYMPPEQVGWPDLLGADRVRLIIPLRVIEELDGHKRAIRPGLAKRARRLLRRLEGDLGATGRTADLNPSVSWEAFVEDPPRWRPEDPDEEILGVAQELQRLGANPLGMATDDAGMRLRARALEIPLVDVPARFRRTQG